MKYKASYDTLTRTITIVIAIGLLAIVGRLVMDIITALPEEPVLFKYFITALIVVVLAGTWLYAPQYYILTDDAFIIKRAIKDVSISFSDISGTSSKDSLPMMRMMGVGGMFGWYGLFSSGDLGKVWAYCTQQNHLVFIKTKNGYPVIISPDEDLLFISDLRAKLK